MLTAAAAPGRASRRPSACLAATLALLAVASPAQEADIAWKHAAGGTGVRLTANPLGIASRIAFYEARGFPAEAIRPYAQACGLSLGMYNGSAATVRTRLAEWQAIGADGRTVALRPPEFWDARWNAAGIPRPARIAFRWAQFQAENVFEPGDWIMGMATLDGTPAEPFRIVARIRDAVTDRADGAAGQETVLQGLECARD